MIAELRRDPAVRSLAKWLPLAVLTVNVGVTFQGTALTAVRGQVGEPSEITVLAIYAAMIWLVLSLYLLIGKTGTRCSPLDMALPLAARGLWLTHMLAVMIAGTSLLGVTVALAVAVSLAFRSLIGVSPFLADSGDVARLVLQLGSGLALAVILLDRPGPTLHEVPRSRRTVLVAILTVVGVFGLIVGLTLLPIVFVIVPVGVALAVGLRTYRSLPPTFALVPLAGDAGVEPKPGKVEPIDGEPRAPSSERSGHASLASGWLLYATVFRSLSKHPVLPLVYAPLIILFGVMLSGVFWIGEGEYRFTWIFLTVYMLFVLFGTSLGEATSLWDTRSDRSIHLLDALPIPRGTMFVVLIVPSLAVLASGYGGSKLVAAAQDTRPELIEYLEDETPVGVRVPMAFHEIAWNGRPSDNGSPWGESHAAWTAPLYTGSEVAVYSPFSTPEGSSPEFVALQLSRAIEAIYGTSVPPEEIMKRYLERDGSDNSRVRATGFTLLEDYPELRARGLGPFFPLIVLVVGLLWLSLAFIYVRTFRPGVSVAVRRTVFWGIAVLVLVLNVAPIALDIAGLLEIHIAGGFLDILIRHLADAMPGGTPAVWGACVLLFLGGYRLTQAQFERLEIPSWR